MKKEIVIVGLFLVFGNLWATGQKEIEIVELPRPNSGTDSHEEANDHKHEIFSIAVSDKDFEWQNPYWGYSVHINENDAIEVLGGSNERTYRVVKLDALEATLVDISSGNPMGILVTSKLDPKESKVFALVIEKLLKPSIQIYYKKKIEPNG